jgi:hypothetical protein
VHRVFGVGMKAYRGEGGGRILLGDGTGGGVGHVAADQVPMCWISNFD